MDGIEHIVDLIKTNKLISFWIVYIIFMCINWTDFNVFIHSTATIYVLGVLREISNANLTQ